MKIPKYFSLREFLYSKTAEDNNIENLPSWGQLISLNKIATEYLDPIRESWGSPLIVSSGYRTEQLNAKLKGSKTSSHKEGKAVDIQPENPTKDNVYELWEFICAFLQKNKMVWDQCYIENSAGKTWWVHLGIGDKLRCEVGSWTKK